ncbi:MAG: hypothetical protein RJQ14_20725 [Marinoscillum sp.]
MASIQAKLKEIDSWIRNRLRYCIWHDRGAQPGRSWNGKGKT